MRTVRNVMGGKIISPELNLDPDLRLIKVPKSLEKLPAMETRLYCR